MAIRMVAGSPDGLYRGFIVQGGIPGQDVLSVNLSKVNDADFMQQGPGTILCAGVHADKVGEFMWRLTYGFRLKAEGWNPNKGKPIYEGADFNAIAIPELLLVLVDEVSEEEEPVGAAPMIEGDEDELLEGENDGPRAEEAGDAEEGAGNDDGPVRGFPAYRKEPNPG